MTDPTTIEEKQPEVSHHALRKTSFFFLLLAIVIAMCALGYGYFQLAKANVALSDKLSLLQKQTTASHDNLMALQTALDALKQETQKSADLSAEQEKMIADWRDAQKGDLNKWYVAEAQYLVTTANDHLQFTHNLALAKVLLERADQVLAKMNEPSVLEIRKSVAVDMANLQALPQIDVTGLYLRLSALNAQLDQLPLPASPLKSETPTPAPIQPGLPWWKAGLAHTWQALSQIVIVRYNGSNALPLVMPDEKAFLYQNLHAEMESAMWAVLQRNADVYQASLARIEEWITPYFVADAPETKTMLQNIQDLRKVNIKPPAVNLSSTLQLFSAYFSQTEQAKAAQ